MAIKIDYTPYLATAKPDFVAKLSPENPLPVLGISIPTLKKIAKEHVGETLSITYLEDVLVENLIVCYTPLPFDEKIPLIEAELPRLTGWMTTDTFACNLKIRKGERDKAYAYYSSLMERKEEMSIRFGIICLLSSFCDQAHIPAILPQLLVIESDAYLVRMAIAWFFATAYAKAPEETMGQFKCLDPYTKKLAKQKCRDSRRVSPALKENLARL